MRPNLLAMSAVLALGLPTAILLGGCGSQTKTVSAAGSPAPEQATAPSTPATTSTTTSTAPAPAQTTTSGGTSAPAATRTAPEPAFTQQPAPAAGASGAAAVVRASGYTPNDVSQYHPNQTLRVLVGTRTGSSDGYGQLAFFFVGNRYIGTDTKVPSATVSVASQGDTEVALAYPLYRSGDALSSPSGGTTIVRFQLNNGKLAPSGAIPPASSSTGLSRL